IASPIAIISGITRNARNGILVKGGVHLEQLGKIDTIAFDKTGTLTKGEPQVEKMIAYDKKALLFAAGSIENSSSHPLAKAIMKEVEAHHVNIAEPETGETIPGPGVTATVAGSKYQLGNEKSVPASLMTEQVKQDMQACKN